MVRSAHRLAVAGLGVLLMVHAPKAEPGSIGLGKAVFATTPSEASSWEQRIAALSGRGVLRLVREQADPRFPGCRNLRYAQHAEGVPIFGAQIVQRMGADGRTLVVCGRLAADEIVATRPSLTPAQAVRIIARADDLDESDVFAPELVWLPFDGRLVLVYTLWSHSPSTYSLKRSFIDAVSGGILLRYEDMRTDAVVGVGQGVWSDSKKISVTRQGSAYVAEDRLRPARIVTYDMRFNRIAFERGLWDDSIASDSDNDWTDGAVVDAHVYAGWTYDYYYNSHGRRGLDDDDMSIRSFVHFDPSYVNAFWSPLRQTMNYGDGGYLNGVYYRPLCSALDVVAHELSHGVTDYTWSGIYLNESGALSETFSDVMATAVEFFYEPVGHGRNHADYWIGEDLSEVFAPARNALRSLADPQILGDPDHYSIRYQGDADNGGVHINCGISSNAFYLLVEGGRNRTSGVSVAGLGAANREKAERIFYRGFTLYLFPSATFADARRATVRAALDLYGADSMEVRQTSAAWSAVGVE
jgi:Zn-dependent metalloprotease